MSETGWLPDPTHSLDPKTGASVEHKDWDAYEMLMGVSTVSASHSNAAFVPYILNQGRLLSCVSHAVATTLRGASIRQLALEGKTLEEAYEQTVFPSRLFLHYLARSTHDASELNVGTWIRAAFEVVNRFGYCDETLWRYEDRVDPEDDGRPARFARLPSHKAFQAAYDRRAAAPENKLVEYRRIYETGYERVAAVKKAVSEGFLVPFGTPVSVLFVEGKTDALRALDPPIGEALAGGHAMVVEGYEGDAFVVTNSWSEGWGDRGRCRLSADYIAWSETRDLWIARQAPP